MKKLCEKKKETILYAELGADMLSGYLFDSCGLIDDKKKSIKYTETDKIADVLKAKIDEIKTDKKRLIVLLFPEKNQIIFVKILLPSQSVFGRIH